MNKKISVREWIKKFNNGDFEAKDFNTQVNAGWYDWFCSDSALSNRLKKMGNIIKDIKNDFVLDNYYVWFKNNCPMTGKLYDDFRLEPFNEELRNKNYFGVTCEDQRNGHKYEIFTGRNDYTTEFTAGNKKELLSIINKLGTELSRN